MFINLYLYHFNQLQEMSELETDDIVDTTDVDTTNQDMPGSFEYDEVVKMKGSLDKATSNYVLP